MNSAKGEDTMPSANDCCDMRIRPYQAACAICRIGAGEPAAQDRIAEIIAAVRADPDMPVMLVCNAGDVFSYQNPGTAEDTPEGPEYNRKRDMDILERMDLAPGSILPARILFRRLLAAVPTVAGICGYETLTGEAWQGCPRTNSGDYERGHEQGINALIAPRDAEEMAADKASSLEDMYGADEILSRPHIVVCAICQYATGTRPPYAPDNLPELLQMVLERDGDVNIKLVPGADWMMCGPCPSRLAETNACICGRISSGGLYNEMKDLNVLQALGLTYGTTMKAGDLYRLIFERIPTVDGVCALKKRDKPMVSLWRDGCGEGTFPGPYERGREILMPRFGMTESSSDSA